MSKSGWKIWSLPFSKSAKELIWNVHTLKEAVGNNPPYLLEFIPPGQGLDRMVWQVESITCYPTAYLYSPLLSQHFC